MNDLLPTIVPADLFVSIPFDVILPGGGKERRSLFPKMVDLADAVEKVEKNYRDKSGLPSLLSQTLRLVENGRGMPDELRTALDKVVDKMLKGPERQRFARSLERAEANLAALRQEFQNKRGTAHAVDLRLPPVGIRNVFLTNDLRSLYESKAITQILANVTNAFLFNRGFIAMTVVFHTKALADLFIITLAQMLEMELASALSVAMAPEHAMNHLRSAMSRKALTVAFLKDGQPASLFTEARLVRAHTDEVSDIIKLGDGPMLFRKAKAGDEDDFWEALAEVEQEVSKWDIPEVLELDNRPKARPQPPKQKPPSDTDKKKNRPLRYREIKSGARRSGL